MKLKAYDKYHKHELLFDFGESIDLNSYASHHASGTLFFTVELVGEGEDPPPERWSDLEQFEVVPS